MTERLDIVIGERGNGAARIERSLEQIARSTERIDQRMQRLMQTMRRMNTQDPTRNAERGMNRLQRVIARVTSAFGRMRRAASSTLSTLSKFTIVAAGIAGAVRLTNRLIGNLSAAADRYTSLTNRLKVITRFQPKLGIIPEDGPFGYRAPSELSDVRATLFNIASRNFSDIDAVGELFQRFTLATRNLNLQLKDRVALTEDLVRISKLSGGTTQEQAGALRQLSQGLAANALRGQELNSVMEQMPLLAAVIAKEMKAGLGDLRKLGEEGKITGEVVVKALQNSSQGVLDAFRNVTPTISDAIQVMENEFSRALGDSSGGVFGNLARGIADVAFHASAFIQAMSEEAVVMLERLATKVREVSPDLANLLSGLGSGNLSFETILLGAAALLDGIVGRIRGAFNAMVAFFSQLADNVVSFFQNAFNTVLEIIEKAVNAGLQAISSLKAALGFAAAPGAAQGLDIAAAAARAVGQENIANALAIRSQLSGGSARFGLDSFKYNNVTQGASAATAAVNAYNESVQDQNFFQDLANRLLGRTNTILQEREAAEQRVRSGVTQTTNEYQNQSSALERLLGQGNRTFSGLQNGMNQLGRTAGNVGNTINNVFVNAFSSLEQALVQFVQTGKLDFKQLINSILADLARMVVQMLITRPLLGFFGGLFGGFSGFGFGFSGGGIAGSFGGVPLGFASGGIVGGFGGRRADNIPAMLSRGEAVIDAKTTANNRDMITSLITTGQPIATGGGGNVVQVNTPVHVTVQGGQGGRAEEDGAKAGRAAAAQIRAVVVEVLRKEKRPGGVLNQGKVR